MQNNERVTDDVELHRTALEGNQSGIWTAMPAIITQVDYKLGTVSAKPAIKGRQRMPDGSTADVSMPLCVDVPIVLTRGGNYVAAPPVIAGDHCLLVFASRCIDGWWSQGGEAPALDARMHDLSDAFAIVGPFAAGRLPVPLSSTDFQIRSLDGSQKISLGPAGANVTAANIALNGNVAITGSSLTHNGKNVGSTHQHSGVQAGSANSGPPQ